MTVSAQQRFTKERPCPVCGGHSKGGRGQGKRCYGYRADNPGWVYCTREECAGSLTVKKGTDAFSHWLAGDCRCGMRHDPRSPISNGTGKALEASYDYHDAQGNLIFQVVRYQPKDFRQRRPDGTGGWIWDLKDVEPVLYHLNKVITADPEKPIFITEGEKHADRLIELGLTATSFPMGALKSHLVKDWSPLWDRHIVILPDHDPRGQQHALQILIANVLSLKQSDKRKRS